METGDKSGNKNPGKKNLASGPKLVTLKLADGNVYDLAPLTLNKLVEFEEKFGQPAGELISGGRMLHIRHLVYLRLRDKYPELTEEKVGNLIDTDVLDEVRLSLGA